jgi:hypothetical protein
LIQQNTNVSTSILKRKLDFFYKLYLNFNKYLNPFLYTHKDLNEWGIPFSIVNFFKIYYIYIIGFLIVHVYFNFYYFTLITLFLIYFFFNLLYLILLFISYLKSLFNFFFIKYNFTSMLLSFNIKLIFFNIFCIFLFLLSNFLLFILLIYILFFFYNYIIIYFKTLLNEYDSTLLEKQLNFFFNVSIISELFIYFILKLRAFCISIRERCHTNVYHYGLDYGEDFLMESSNFDYKTLFFIILFFIIYTSTITFIFDKFYFFIEERCFKLFIEKIPNSSYKNLEFIFKLLFRILVMLVLYLFIKLSFCYFLSKFPNILSFL